MTPTEDDVAWARATLAQLQFAPDDALDPAEAALAFGVTDRADGVLAPVASESKRSDCECHLEKLAAEAEPAVAAAATAEDARAALAGVIAAAFGYRGDLQTYDDLQNADLIRVVDRRRGLPVALGALYATTARRLGVAVHGLAFPGHFLMRVEVGGARIAFDPFHDGAAVDTPEMRALAKTALGESAELKPAYFDTVTNRQIVLRLRNNIKVRLLRDGRLREAAAVADGMAAFAPDEFELLREIGLIRARLGELTAARRALTQYLAIAPDDAGQRKAQQLLDEIDRRLQ